MQECSCGSGELCRQWTVDMQQLFCPSSYSPSAPDKLGHFALSWSSGTQRGLCRCVDSTYVAAKHTTIDRRDQARVGQKSFNTPKLKRDNADKMEIAKISLFHRQEQALPLFVWPLNCKIDIIR